MGVLPLDRRHACERIARSTRGHPAVEEQRRTASATDACSLGGEGGIDHPPGSRGVDSCDPGVHQRNPASSGIAAGTSHHQRGNRGRDIFIQRSTRCRRHQHDRACPAISRRNDIERAASDANALSEWLEKGVPAWSGYTEPRIRHAWPCLSDSHQRTNLAAGGSKQNPGIRLLLTACSSPEIWPGWRARGSFPNQHPADEAPP